MIDNIKNIEFVHPWLLLLLAIVPMIWWWQRTGYRKRETYIPFPSLNGLENIKSNWKVLLYYTMPYLKLTVLALFILALARPQLTLKQQSVNAEGIDIMLVMDISPSMLAMDFKPNRLEVSKKVAKDFIANRPYDRIGLVIFSGEAFTFSPITTDHEILNKFIDQIQTGILKDGTAIGNGLAAAVNRLKNSKSKSKIIILLTDGENNAGYISPETSMEMAKRFKIKVYTIGIGTNGITKMPVQDIFGNTHLRNTRVVIDEKLLTKIANETGGMYFRAKNKEELEKIYDYIDKLEKTKIEVKVFKRYSEEFRIFLIPALILLLLIFFMKKSVLLIKP